MLGDIMYYWYLINRDLRSLTPPTGAGSRRRRRPCKESPVISYYKTLQTPLYKGMLGDFIMY